MAKEYIEREAFIAEKREHFCMDCNKRKGIKDGKVQFCYDIGDIPCCSCDVEDMLDYIDSFPAADVAPVVRGRWDNASRISRKGFEWFKCSNCGMEWSSLTNFCPNCGADMREVDDED